MFRHSNAVMLLIIFSACGLFGLTSVFSLGSEEEKEDLSFIRSPEPEAFVHNEPQDPAPKNNRDESLEKLSSFRFPSRPDLQRLLHTEFDAYSGHCTAEQSIVYDSSLIHSGKTCRENTIESGSLYLARPSVIKGVHPFSVNIEENLLFRSLRLERYSSITAGGFLWGEERLLLSGESETIVAGSALITDSLELSGASFFSSSDLSAGSLHITGSSELQTDGKLSTGSLAIGDDSSLKSRSLKADGPVLLHGENSQLEVHSMTLSNGFASENQASLTIEKGITIDGDTALKDETVFMSGNAAFNGDLDYDEAVRVHIKGDMTVDGNIGSRNRWQTGRICVEGSLEVSGSIPDPLAVITNASSCEDQPPGTIYVKNQS